MNFLIQDKVAFVTGSTSGLGTAIASAFASEGCRVVLKGRDRARLTNPAGRTEAVAAFRADVSVPDEAVCTGHMQTERVNDLVRERALRENRDADGILAELGRRIPMRRLGKPEELVHVVTFLSSEQAGYITGVALQVNGGYIRSIV